MPTDTERVAAALQEVNQATLRAAAIVEEVLVGLDPPEDRDAQGEELAALLEPIACRVLATGDLMDMSLGEMNVYELAASP